jgi:hypothetical protein
LISKPIYSYALPQSELLGNGAITPARGCAESVNWNLKGAHISMKTYSP